ncbi:uncharacterized protein GGS22DRAFT_186715 [Annulohypoxylon maeteangense]|uniref:uncharacterized protein n=1 Tax=Annulohypoxylon maeteangense TaxID=1927788 RepID=UPI0020085C84|nr:uncharacterized protein GGS22DRAFT_186715 [Annulohypoxylon maeteangense]KAI0886645.1 hypothetical protein GGS22DRAFT_186715 [Annulohypoxylon maeteangense]
MSSMPLVFTSDEKVISTTDWYSSLTDDISKYENCFVRRITHVKNLRSSVLHEYLQIIFEDTTGKQNRTRVLAERQTAQDQVIIGRWSYGLNPSANRSSSSGSSGSWGRGLEFFQGSSSSSSSSPGGNLPLPLLSLTFKEDKLGVMQLAAILQKITVKLGKYNFLLRNCYVFASMVYDLAMVKHTGSSQSWPYAFTKGRLALWAKIHTGSGKSAGDFESLNKSEWQYAPANKFEESLGNFWSSAVDLLRQEGIDLTNEEAQKLSTSCKMYDLSDDATAAALKDVDKKELDELYRDTVDKVLAQPGVDDYLATYQRYADRIPEPTANQNRPENLPGIEIYKVSDDLEQKNEMVIKILVGEVLQDLEKN